MPVHAFCTIFVAPKMYKDMADKRMNEFVPVTDGAYIYGEAANGSQMKIKKSDLLNGTFQIRGTVDKSLDEYTVNGCYGIHASIFNVELISFGILLVFSAPNTAMGGNPIFQMIIGADGVMFTRIRWYNGGWTLWKKISFTSI